MNHQPPHLKLVNNTSGTCKVFPTTELNSLTCPCSQQPMHNLWNHSRADGVASTKPVPKMNQQPPHKQGPVGPAPHSRTTSPSLLTSNGATRHTASPVSHQLPHNQESPHNNANGNPSPLNYMYQWTNTFPAPDTTHGTSGTISPHCNWT